ncbi:MAG: hypothetical protein ABS78_09575 [Phenylobacterium sp. SCN 70-31]|nr:MAG: hypothetical protein ABS78_09575 [Phenylobacterium sp. SCN 70-31]
MELKDIPGRLKASNRTQADLARHLDLDPSSLTKTIKGLRNVQAAEVVKIEEFFGEKLTVVAAETRLIGSRRAATGRRVPVFGYLAKDTLDQISLGEDHVLEWREPPPYWSGAGELMYVRIIGDVMEPRYFDGELVPIRYGVPPAKGEDCLVEYKDGGATVRRYGGRASTMVLLGQYHPPTEQKIDATKVKALHAVWRPALI